MKELDGKIVRFIAIDKRYIREPYPAIAPISNSMGTYVTGQHIDPENEESYQNLTEAEMLGEEEIKPAARRKRFIYVINPDNPVHIVHMKKYDCRVQDGKPTHPKDYAEAHFIIHQAIVAPGRDNVKAGKHYFYLEDKEAEAKKTIDTSRVQYEAEKLIREFYSVSDYRDIISLFNLKHAYFNENVRGMSETRMLVILLKEAKENPQNILFLQDDAARDELFLAKLVYHGIIRNTAEGFYDGRQFAARTLGELVVLLHSDEGQAFLDKWGKQLKEKE